MTNPYGPMEGVPEAPDVPGFRFCQTSRVWLCDICPYQNERNNFECMVHAIKDVEAFADWLRTKRARLMRNEGML